MRWAGVSITAMWRALSEHHQGPIGEETEAQGFTHHILSFSQEMLPSDFYSLTTGGLPLNSLHFYCTLQRYYLI